MSSARWDPKKGQWGWFGRDQSSREGKLQNWLRDQPGYTASKQMRGFATVPERLQNVDIPNLGAEKYRTGYGAQVPFASFNVLESKTSKATPGEFEKAYVKPQVKFMTKDPLTEIGTVRAPGTAGTEGTAFTELEEADLPTDFREGADAFTGKAIMPEGQDVAGILGEAARVKGLAETEYQDRLATLEGEEKTAEKARRLGKAELTRGRFATEAESGSAYQESEARKAATGMAYSAPAEQAAAKGMAGVEAQLGTISTKDILGKEKYESELERIEGETAAAESKWGTAQYEYGQSLEAAYEASNLALDDIWSQMEGIYGAYQTGFGQKGLKDIGFYGEGKEMPEYQKAKETYGEAEAFGKELLIRGEQIQSDLGNV